MLRKAVLFLSILPGIAFCQATELRQTPPPAKPAIPVQDESIVVTGTFVPALLSENDRSVDAFDTRENPLLFNSVVDYLQSDPKLRRILSIWSLMEARSIT